MGEVEEAKDAGLASSPGAAQSRGNNGHMDRSGHLSDAPQQQAHDKMKNDQPSGGGVAAAMASPIVVEQKSNQSGHPATSSTGSASSLSSSSTATSGEDANNLPQRQAHQASTSLHDQQLEFTFANFDPRDFASGGGDRLYLADDDHYSHEIKKNNALNQKFNNHNYYAHQAGAGRSPGAVAATVTAGSGTSSSAVDSVEDEAAIVDRLMMGFVDGSAHSVSGMIGRPGSGGGSSSVLIDKDLINDGKKPKPVAIGDSKFPPVNSKG